MSPIFITGTDTDAGKTVVSAAIIKAVASQGVRAVGLKPIASGFDMIDGHLRNADVDALTDASNVYLPEKIVNRYAFQPAIAPHIAAAQEGEVLDFHAIQQDVAFAKGRADFVLVEGVGGWHVPLSDPSIGSDGGVVKDIESLAQHLALPIVLVIGLRLGCINHAVLTARAIVNSGLPLLGWVANHVDPHFDRVAENITTLEALLSAPKLFELPYLESSQSLEVEKLAQLPFIQSLSK